MRYALHKVNGKDFFSVSYRGLVSVLQEIERMLLRGIDSIIASLRRQNLAAGFTLASE